ncbi:unnamed protein product, partial [Chrysoparadoxa australica]
MATTPLYLLQKAGPSCFILKGDASRPKFRVLIGSQNTCSCGASATSCVHQLFVLLKVLRVEQTSPLAWQQALLDDELEKILGGGGRQGRRRAAGPFLRKGGGEEASDGSACGAAVTRQELVEGEICPICQEVMTEGSGGQPLTHCNKGCGANLHIRCMKMYAEHCLSQTHAGASKIRCPLCRSDWGSMAMHKLKEEV